MHYTKWSDVLRKECCMKALLTEQVVRYTVNGKWTICVLLETVVQQHRHVQHPHCQSCMFTHSSQNSRCAVSCNHKKNSVGSCLVWQHEYQIAQMHPTGDQHLDSRQNPNQSSTATIMVLQSLFCASNPYSSFQNTCHAPKAPCVELLTHLGSKLGGDLCGQTANQLVIEHHHLAVVLQTIDP